MNSGQVIKSLDGLRGIAVLIVIFSHTGASGLWFSPYLNLAGFGQFGVLLFFFLSAFSLSRQFFRNESMMYQPKEWIFYLVKRLFRILPMYYFILLMDYFVLHTYIKDPEALKNHLLFKEGFAIYWTMPVEMKFYLTLPIWVFLLVFCFKHKVTKILLAVVLIGYLILNFIYAGTLLPIETLYIHRYVPCFILGVVTSYLFIRTEQKPLSLKWRIVNESIAAVCVLFLFIQIPYVWHSLNGQSFDYAQVNWEAYYTYRPILSTPIICMMVYCYLRGVGAINAILSSKILRVVGHVSFSMYLIHMHMIFYTKTYFPSSIFMQTLVVFVGVFLISLVTYYVIERPFILLPKYIRSKRIKTKAPLQT